MKIELNIPKYFESFVIRDWRLDDAVALANIEYDTGLKKYFELPVLPKGKFIAEFNVENVRGYAIEALPEKVVAGTIDFSSFRGNNRQKELRIFISEDFQGKGIGYIAAKYFIACLLKVDWVDSIIGVVHYKNEGSRALMMKLGFLLIGPADNSENEVFELKRNT